MGYFKFQIDKRQPSSQGSPPSISKLFSVVTILLFSPTAHFIYLHLSSAVMWLVQCLLLAQAKLVLSVYFSPGLFPRLRVEFLNTTFVS